MLDKLASGAFHWRGAVTNGFQQGFFVNALRGYCLERMGDIVKAYRAYQNSRACFNDEAVAVQCPEPRLEVFLGLGRTCLVAGRYTDAFNWLDLVRLEASAEPRIAAAADRALIRRAVEIGDYHDAITNYLDLQFQLAECEESQDGDHSHTAVGGTGQASGRSRHGGRSQAEKSTSKFVRRERIYSPQEYTELSQLYFWTYQDRPGFKTLLDGLTLLGIDNDLGVNDPMVNCFLNNIMRVDDSEIQRFYDLLGYAITQARGLKHDEDYLAFLLSSRDIMGTIHHWLKRDSDLEALRARIAHVSSKTAKGIARAPARKGVWASDIYSHHPGGRSAADYGDANHPLMLVCEDLLMEADLLLSCHLKSRALQSYEEALDGITNTARTSFGIYDGTTYERAALMGREICLPIVSTTQSNFLSVANAVSDACLRVRCFALQTILRSGIGDSASARVTLDVSATMPDGYPLALETLKRVCEILYNKSDYVNCRLLIGEYGKRKHTSTLGIAAYHILCCLRTDSYKAATQAALDSLRSSADTDLMCSIYDVLYTMVPVMSQEEISNTRACGMKLLTALFVTSLGTTLDSWKRDTAKRIETLRTAVLIEQHSKSATCASEQYCQCDAGIAAALKGTAMSVYIAKAQMMLRRGNEEQSLASLKDALLYSNLFVAVANGAEQAQRAQVTLDESLLTVPTNPTR